MKTKMEERSYAKTKWNGMEREKKVEEEHSMHEKSIFGLCTSMCARIDRMQTHRFFPFSIPQLFAVCVCVCLGGGGGGICM